MIKYVASAVAAVRLYQDGCFNTFAPLKKSESLYILNGLKHINSLGGYASHTNPVLMWFGRHTRQQKHVIKTAEMLLSTHEEISPLRAARTRRRALMSHQKKVISARV